MKLQITSKLRDKIETNLLEKEELKAIIEEGCIYDYKKKKRLKYQVEVIFRRTEVIDLEENQK